MIFLNLTVVLLLSIFLGKYYFRKYINPIFIYSVIWYGLLTFFHLKLINYDNLSIDAWIIIIFSYVSFILGILVYFTAIRIFNVELNWTEESSRTLPNLFKFDGKILKYLIIFFSILGLIGAIQHWSILINKYGSIVEVFLHLGLIRQLTVRGEIVGILPYISGFSFVAIFFAGIYSAWKGKITLVSFLPLIAIILKDTAAAGRVGILIAFIEFGLSYIFTSYYINNFVQTNFKKNNIRIYFSITIALLIFFTSIFMIKGLRGGSEEVYGASRGMSSFSNNLFITPTLYLYFSGHVGVLSKYLEKNTETARFGENSFRFVYNVLNKFGFTDNAEMYQRGYYIPIWHNTGTFLRELHADFGIGGTLLFLFLLGIIISFVWFNFYRTGNFIYLVYLVYLSLIIAMSFLMMITRITTWTIGLITILSVISIIEKFYSQKLNSLSK